MSYPYPRNRKQERELPTIGEIIGGLCVFALPIALFFLAAAYA